MLMNELWSLQKLDHPFIIRLHFAFHDSASCFFVFDLKTGGDLRHYLRKKLLFEEQDVAFYVACLSSALDYIHSKGILHRDVKPGRMLKQTTLYLFFLVTIAFYCREHHTRRSWIPSLG